MTVTRFAPSPTGSLHIGSARTALFCWLYAKKTHGQFILRIEDTDTERSTTESVNAILDAMAWLNLNYDQGPYYQTARFDRYKAAIQQLIDQGKAYRCVCSKERLEALREEQMAAKLKPRYDGHCRNLSVSVSDSHVVRFLNPEEGVVEFDDLIRGKVVFANNELDDLIIARTDGTPTYNFTVVVDDWDMGITHVIRGDDHINNTPRQINILQALGAKVPLYAHVPMILGSDGKRLSKRHGAASVMNYRDEGYLPEALLNYLVRLGWSHGDQEIFSLEDMIRYFEIKDIHKSPAAINPEKLLWLNHHYMKCLSQEALMKHLEWHLNALGVDYKEGPALSDLANVFIDRCKTLREMAEKCKLFFSEVHYAEEAVTKFITPETLPTLKALYEGLAALSEWTKEAIHHVLTDTADQLNVKMGQVAQPLRVAITGDTQSPSIDITLALLGRDKVLARLGVIVKKNN